MTSNSNIIVAGTHHQPERLGHLQRHARRADRLQSDHQQHHADDGPADPDHEPAPIAADAIGTADRPINATITANSGGTFNAQARTGDIYANLNSASEARAGVGRRHAERLQDVNIIAKGSLTRGNVPQDFAGSAGSDINVRARNINLTSTEGSVGSVSDLLKISANATSTVGRRSSTAASSISWPMATSALPRSPRIPRYSGVCVSD